MANSFIHGVTKTSKFPLQMAEAAVLKRTWRRNGEHLYAPAGTVGVVTGVQVMIDILLALLLKTGEELLSVYIAKLKLMAFSGPA